MTWLRSALTISCPQSNAYYTALDPIEYYEWEFTGQAPEGHLFTKQLPPTEIFTSGKIVVSVLVDPGNLNKVERGYRLKKSADVKVSLTAGEISSPREIIEKHRKIHDQFRRDLDSFKTRTLTKLFFIASKMNDAHLYGVKSSNEGKVILSNFGEIKDLMNKFSEVKEALSNMAEVKRGRAFETEEFHRFNNVLTYIKNNDLDLDPSKIQRLLISSQISPVYEKEISWTDCFIQLSPEAKVLADKLKRFHQFRWVQASCPQDFSLKTAY